MTPETMPHHRLSIDAQVGSLVVAAQLAFRAPWTVLFGPSGSGKSSVLRAMCGLAAGDIQFERREGEGWERVDGLPVHRRALAYAPQGGMVFPHLSVRKNVAFAEDGPLTAAALEMFELGSMVDRMPGSLSGGERQRVSLARAFAVPQARLMLLDEPFTGLDRGLRERLLLRMQAELARRGVPVVSVTHDVEEALLLGAEVVRLERGLVLAQGAGKDVLAEECAAMRRVLG